MTCITCITCKTSWSEFQRLGPIDRTPGIPGSDKNQATHHTEHPNINSNIRFHLNLIFTELEPRSHAKAIIYCL